MTPHYDATGSVDPAPDGTTAADVELYVAALRALDAFLRAVATLDRRTPELAGELVDAAIAALVPQSGRST